MRNITSLMLGIIFVYGAYIWRLKCPTNPIAIPASSQGTPLRTCVDRTLMSVFRVSTMASTQGIHTGGKHLQQRLREHSMLAYYPTSLNLSIHSVEPLYFSWQKVGSCTKTWSNVFLEHENPAPLWCFRVSVAYIAILQVMDSDI